MRMNGNRTNKPTSQITRMMRWLRFFSMGAILAAAGYLIVRYDSVRVGPFDDTARPAYAPDSTLLIDTWDPLGERGSHHVAFRVAGEAEFRIGRVVARSGQRIHRTLTAEGFVISVDGESTGLRVRPFDEAAHCELTVPADQVYVISLVPGSNVPDSRTMGPFRKQQLAGRVLVQLPW
jgi:hypothetical protein